jgi:hypothetical protein
MKMRLMTGHKILGLLAILAGFALVPTASASIVLNISDGNGTGPFGVINLTQVDSDTVHVNLVMNASPQYQLVDTGSHDTFGFNLFNSLVVNPNISITGLTAGFYVGTGFTNGFTGPFVYSVGCVGPTGTKPPDACASGASNPAPGPLNFDVNISVGSLSVTDFTANASGHTFAADVYGPKPTGGNFTGLVTTTGTGTAVPEPITSGLVGTGLIALFFVRHRASRKA